MRVTTYTDARWNTPATEKTVFNTFAASKMQEAKSGSMHVEYTDFMGRKQIIPCKNRTQLKAAGEFLAMFKRENAVINTICAQYQVRNGKFCNKAALVKDLMKVTGMTPKAVKLLTVLS
jgi:hypothetical protein